MDDLRQHMAYYFEEISYGIKIDTRKFKPMEYINFAITDIVTAFYHSLPNKDKPRFLANIISIGNILTEQSKSED